MPTREELPEFARTHQLGKLAMRTDSNGWPAVAVEGDYEADTELVDDPADAEVVLSLTGLTKPKWGVDQPLHRPIFDVDFPVAAVPSSTPGHFHLYFDKKLTWHQYRRLLVALEDVGIIEPGYLSASEVRQFTSVRMPSVKKPPAPEPAEPPTDPDQLADLLL